MGLVAPQHVGSSWTRGRTRVPRIGGWIPNPPDHQGSPLYVLQTKTSAAQVHFIFLKPRNGSTPGKQEGSKAGGLSTESIIFKLLTPVLPFSQQSDAE